MPWLSCDVTVISTKYMTCVWILNFNGLKVTSLNENNFCMMTSSNGNIFRVTGPLCGEFTGPGEFPTQRPVTRSFDVFFDLRLNKRLSKQPWGWWCETQSWSLWRHCNGIIDSVKGESIGHRGFPSLKSCDTEICRLLWCRFDQIVEQTVESLMNSDVLVTTLAS